MTFRMTKCFIIIYCTLLLFILSSCDKDEAIVEQYQFPFKVGNEWTYIRTQNIINVIPNHDSIIDIHDTVITWEINITLHDYTSPVDSTNCIQLEGKYIKPSGGSTGYYNYYKVFDDGLYRHHEVSGGLQVISLFPCRNDDYFCGGIFPGKASTSYDFNKHILKYPLDVGMEWICSSSTGLSKKVTGKETIQFKGQNYSCYKIEYIYSSDTLSSTTDYISDIGLIKRIRFIPDINIDGKGKGEFYETFELIDLSLNVED